MNDFVEDFLAELGKPINCTGMRERDYWRRQLYWIMEENDLLYHKDIDFIDKSIS